MAYDNTNQCGAWLRKAICGTPKLGGVDYYLSIVQTPPSVEKPSHNLYLTCAADYNVEFRGVLFRPDKPEHGLASGKVNVAGFEYYVNVYRNTKEGDTTPFADVKFKLKDPQAAAQPAAAGTPEGDDIPF